MTKSTANRQLTEEVVAVVGEGGGLTPGGQDRGICHTHVQGTEQDGGHLGRAESCVTKRGWGVKGTKAITGYWDGNAKDEGSGCGVVIKVTDRGGGVACGVQDCAPICLRVCDAGQDQGM